MADFGPVSFSNFSESRSINEQESDLGSELRLKLNQPDSISKTQWDRLTGES